MPTHYEGTEVERTTLDSFIKFMRASESVTSQLAQALGEYQLTMSQFGTLEVLYHLGPMCQKAIGAKLLKSGGNITMVVNNLEDRGLVSRKRRESDRRFVTVELTAEGVELIEEVLPNHVARIVDIFGVLSSSEQEQLGELCKRIGLAASAEDES